MNFLPQGISFPGPAVPVVSRLVPPALWQDVYGDVLLASLVLQPKASLAEESVQLLAKICTALPGKGLG